MLRNAPTPFGGSYGASDPFLTLHREMNRLFDDVIRGDSPAPAAAAGRGGVLDARLNVSETEKELRITAELPGVREEDVDVTLDDDVLTIRGEKRFEQERGGEKENYHVMECAYGTFQRSLRLPYAVNSDEVKADFRSGVLTVTVPKSAQQQRARRIPLGRSDTREAQEGGEPARSEVGRERSAPGAGEQPATR